MSFLLLCGWFPEREFSLGEIFDSLCFPPAVAVCSSDSWSLCPLQTGCQWNGLQVFCVKNRKFMVYLVYLVSVRISYMPSISFFILFFLAGSQYSPFASFFFFHLSVHKGSHSLSGTLIPQKQYFAILSLWAPHSIMSLLCCQCSNLSEIFFRGCLSGSLS